MTKQTSVMLGGIIALCLIGVIVLTALGKPTDTVIGFMTSAIIPTIVALWAGGKADKAAKASESAEANTNGRMSELIKIIQDQGKGDEIDEEAYQDVIEPDAKG